MAGMRYHLGQAASCLRQSPTGALVAASTIAVALSLAALSLVAGRTVESVLRAMAAEARITVFLRPEATTGVDFSKPIVASATKNNPSGPSIVDFSRLAIEKAGPGATAELIPPDVAMKRLKEELGESGKALDGLAANPLPASIEVRLPAQAVATRGLAEVRAASARLASLPFAAEVDYGETFIEKLESVLLATRAIGAGALAAALLLAMFLVTAVVRLAIHARRDEIDILRLVGATDGFIAVPFVLEGAAQGFAGGTIAAVVVSLVERLAMPIVLSQLGFARELAIPALGPLLLLALIGAGTLFGAVASLVTVVRFLRSAV